MKQKLIGGVNALSSLGFLLIIGSVIYFIIGFVASLVQGTMLKWSFCSSAHYLFNVEWCAIGNSSNATGVEHFIHRLFNISLPWFMMFWGLVLTSASSLLLKILSHQYVPSPKPE